MLIQVQAWMVACVFFFSMFLFWGLGWRSGRRRPPRPDDAPAQKLTDSSLAILGLLLAFTFSMAVGRHDQRRLKVVEESNAIGDFYTCATILKDPHRSTLQSLIRTYATNELPGLSQFLPDADRRELMRKSLEMQNRMTDLVAAAVAEGTPIAVVLTNNLNHVTSANASRLAAYEEVLPWSIQLLLLLASCVPSFLIGRLAGAAGKIRGSGTVNFIVLVTLVVYVTLDLNQGRRGLIRVNTAPFERLSEAIGGPPIPSPGPDPR